MNGLLWFQVLQTKKCQEMPRYAKKCQDAGTSCPSLAGSSMTSMASGCFRLRVVSCTGCQGCTDSFGFRGSDAPLKYNSQSPPCHDSCRDSRDSAKPQETSRKLRGAPASAGSFSQSARALGTSELLRTFSHSLHLTSRNFEQLPRCAIHESADISDLATKLSQNMKPKDD